MEEIIKQSIEYLKTTEDKDWDIFINKHVCIVDNDILKEYVLEVRKDLISCINRMKLTTFPLVRLKKNYFSMDRVEAFISYFNDEKECLINLKKFLRSNYTDSSNLTPCQISGLLVHTLGNTHTDNQQRLLQSLKIDTAINSGIDVYIDEEKITPVNHQLVKTINKRLKQK